MVEKPLSFSEGVVPLGHLCPLSSLEFMKDVVLGKYFNTCFARFVCLTLNDIIFENVSLYR